MMQKARCADWPQWCKAKSLAKVLKFFGQWIKASATNQVSQLVQPLCCHEQRYKLRSVAKTISHRRAPLCKQAFTPRNHSGHIGWAEFCKEFLTGRLVNAWENLVDDLLLNYVDMRAGDAKDFFRNDLRWEHMYRFSEESALGSQDAMILNLLDSSVFPMIVTMDFDLAYGVMLSTKDKAALVPDNLHRNRIKKLKF